jgi:SAM-dependent methyltransferase
MAFQNNGNTFNADRAIRYKLAMNTCPVARYLEVLPLLCLCARPEVKNWDVVDLGSGTGYLASFFEGVASNVLRVDKSYEQLKDSGSRDIIVSDMRHSSQAIGNFKADLICCLASFHHIHVPEVPDTEKVFNNLFTRHWTPERHLDILASQDLQSYIIADWCESIKPGGWLILIDIPGYPDKAWDLFWPERKQHTVNTRAYHESFLEHLADWPLEVDLNVLSDFFSKEPLRTFWNTDKHLEAIRKLLKSKLSMKELIQSYGVPKAVLKQSGPMIPADFFDEVVDRLGAQRHYGYYPRETSFRSILEGNGMEEVQIGTFSAPWLFENKRTAAWFIHELLGLGQPWELDSIPQNELDALIQYLEKYLGFYQDDYGRTMLYWQLGYFTARKPKN